MIQGVLWKDWTERSNLWKIGVDFSNKTVGYICQILANEVPPPFIPDNPLDFRGKMKLEGDIFLSHHGNYTSFTIF